MSDYPTDREFADRMIREVRRIVGPYLLQEATIELDQEQATDLWVFRAKDMRIAARVRRPRGRHESPDAPSYAQRYPYDITLRSHRESGSKTEYAKIMDGWADWMFYGHADELQKTIWLWWLIDLHIFRKQIMDGKVVVPQDKANGDGTWFKPFDMRRFTRDIRIGASGVSNGR
jgi:hypothetical protein